MIMSEEDDVTDGATVVHFIVRQLDRAADHIGIIISVLIGLGNCASCPKTAFVSWNGWSSAV